MWLALPSFLPTECLRTEGEHREVRGGGGVCSSLYGKALPSYTVNYTHAPRAEYAAIKPTTSMPTGTIEPFL